MTVTLYFSLLIICLATTAPSVWSLNAHIFGQTDYPSCVNEHCNISKPYCYLFYDGLKAGGMCVPSKHVPVCTTFTDLPANGCICNDTKCVVYILTADHTNNATQMPAITVQPTTQPLHMTPFGSLTDSLCNFHHCPRRENTCHLQVDNGEIFGWCTTWNPNYWRQVCFTSYDLELPAGCVCITQDCITRALTVYATKYLTTQSTTTSSLPTATTTLLPTKTTSTSTSVSTTPVVTSFAPSISTVDETSTTMFASGDVTTSTEVPHTTFVPSSTKATVTTTMEQSWTCLDKICQKHEVCRLKLSLYGINATCENGTQTGLVCADHSSISKDGCLCSTETCVVSTALQCLGTKCPVEKTVCRVYKLKSGSFSGICTNRDFSFPACPQQSENFIQTCDCFTQSCVDVYKMQPSTSQPQASSQTPRTTTAPARKCHICGDQSNGMPCSSKEINNSPQTMCTSGEYCMTDVLQDVQGNLEVYKRCVDTTTCEKEWIQETADHDYCKRYGTVINPGAFSCHFCCDSDGCNTNILPNSSTWYSTQNGK